MTVRELRQKYLEFFESKGHSRHPSGSLVPYDVTGRLDESLLFNGAGMVQFKPYFRGIAKPANPRLTTAQKCVRTGDIESVGDLSHLTFFEMLGNFSFGDYFKNEAIAFSWEFLTDPKWLGLDPRKLSFTVFEEDDEAYGCWSAHLRAAGLNPETRVFRLGEETNYWPAGAFSSGPPGPCGPNSEMFYWTADGYPPEAYSREDWLRDDEAKNWLEIWNDVFIQYEWQGELKNPDRPSDGYRKTGMPNLPFQSIDTGMGLERTAAVLGGKASVYDTDAFAPILKKIEEIAGGWTYGSDEAKDTAARIIADHIRTACFCIADGILPSNTGRGYVLRRLIRRAVLKGQRVLGFDQPFFHEVALGVEAAMADHYTELRERRDVIQETLKAEEDQFRRTVRRGSEILEEKLLELVSMAVINLVAVVHRGPHRTLWMEYFNSIQFIPGKGLEFSSNRIGAGLIDQVSPTLTFVRSNALALSKELKTKLVGPENEHILETLEAAEEQARRPVLGGNDAFMLYDTYGFPLEVTQEICAEAGVEVDLEGYERALKEAQERSRGSQDRETVYGGVVITLTFDSEQGGPTAFAGYDDLVVQATVAGALATPGQDGAPSQEFVVALDQTPFYAQSGGQVSDTGFLRGDGFELRVVDVTKQDGVYVHLVEPVRMDPPVDLAGLPIEEATRLLNSRFFQQSVVAAVDAPRRRRIERNHTATHLLHAALRQVLGKHVAQAGSYVGPDRLRFDFTHGKAMTPDELTEVERIVNEKALDNLGILTYVDLPIEEARAMGAMALFGEKYGDRVRMVQIGSEPPERASFSRELCGGTHVGATGEIGLIKLVHEGSAAGGVRRVEALTGDGAYAWVLEEVQRLREAASLLKAPPRDLIPALERHLEAQRELAKKLEKLRTQGAGGDAATIAPVNSVELATQLLTDGEPRDAGLVADRLADNHPNRVVLVALGGERVHFVCKVGADALAKGAHAGNLVREVAKLAGGGGGGKAEFATAGGKDPSKVASALEAAAGILAGMVS